MTLDEQHAILSQTHPSELRHAVTTIQYIEYMIQAWLKKTPWTTRKDTTFGDICDIVLGDEEDIPKDLYGYNEARLLALSKLAETNKPAYEEEVKNVATAWLWRKVQVLMCEDVYELPSNLLEPN